VRTGVQVCFAPRPPGVRYPVAPRGFETGLRPSSATGSRE
jgi:hypothetical protein